VLPEPPQHRSTEGQSEQRDLLQTQRAFVTVKSLANQAKVTFVGISPIARNSPLHENGFINDGELTPNSSTWARLVNLRIEPSMPKTICYKKAL